MSRISNQKIANWLQITAEESAALAAEFGAKAWPPMTGVEYEPAPTPRVVPLREARVRDRRATILAIVRDRRGDPPSVRETLRILDAMGMPAAISTVHRDLRAVGRDEAGWGGSAARLTAGPTRWFLP